MRQATVLIIVCVSFGRAETAGPSEPISSVSSNDVAVESGKIQNMLKEYIEQRESNYYVAGTRISLDSIVYAFRRGESPEGICQNFELLDLEQVYGAIAYYLAHKTEIDSYLMRQNEKWLEDKRNSEPLPATLRERLLRAREEIESTRLS